ncbi:transposase [Vibrio parahaemolyticus]|uniref:transposase n=1 Tax=Vibrio harveyi group TaxID=717610 RepID=UPI0004A2B2DF|nr:transposase [Vibrio parahaemolyticus]
MRNHYPKSLKNLALNKILNMGCTTSQVAQELKVSKSTLYSWLRAEKSNFKNSKEPLVVSRLEAELKIAVYERDILAKAIQILLRGSNFNNK